MPADGLFDWLDRFGDAVEAVFHLGAISATTFADADVMIAQQPQLLDRAVALVRRATRKKLIYASSAATYGDGSAGFDDARRHRRRFKRLRPLNLYGWSKHAFDLWALRAGGSRAGPAGSGSGSNSSTCSGRTSTTRAR